MPSTLHCFRDSWGHGAQSGNLRDRAPPARYSGKDCRPRPEAPPGRTPANFGDGSSSPALGPRRILLEGPWD
eukprot:3580281-Pyramimonas_sp.AAC.1